MDDLVYNVLCNFFFLSNFLGLYIVLRGLFSLFLLYFIGFKIYMNLNVNSIRIEIGFVI